MKYNLEKSLTNELRMNIESGKITEITLRYRDEDGLEFCKKAIKKMGFDYVESEGRE